MIEERKEEVKISVQKMDEKMSQLQRRRSFLASEEWRESFTPWLQAQIEPLRVRLERLDLREGETTALRGMLGAWRLLEKLHDCTVAEMETIAEEAAGLQRKLEQWHTRGHTDLSTAVEATGRLVAHKQRNRR